MKKTYSLLLVAVIILCFTKQTKACTANFTYTNVANVFNFTDTSVPSGGSIVSWIWNFGDLSVPGTTQNPGHTYTVCGVYNVSLTIATSFFCTNTYSTTITVNSGFSTSYTSTTVAGTGNTTFNASPVALSINYNWDYGDGVTGTGVVSNHTYGASGTYYACLTASDTAGICTATFCDSVVIVIPPPTCSSTFTYTDNGSGNLNFQVAPFSLTDTYAWDYGDGSTGTGAISLHTYPTAGTYYVCLTTNDSTTMCTSTFCDSVTAAGSATCAVSFTYFDLNGIVAFNATPLSVTNTYAWNFGDGNSGANAVTTNTYASSGIYYVCVTMTDAFNSCTVTYCDSVVTSIINIGISEHKTDSFHLTASPNPVTDQVTISYQLAGSSNTTIELTDVLGNKISSVNLSQAAGKYQIPLNTENLSKGAYLVKLTSENGFANQLIIKN